MSIPSEFYILFFLHKMSYLYLYTCYMYRRVLYLCTTPVHTGTHVFIFWFYFYSKENKVNNRSIGTNFDNSCNCKSNILTLSKLSNMLLHIFSNWTSLMLPPVTILKIQNRSSYPTVPSPSTYGQQHKIPQIAWC